MTATPTSFLVAITAYNAAAFVDKLVESLKVQVHPGWKAVFIDDCSTDGTTGRLRALLNDAGLSERFSIIENTERRYKARNLYDALQTHGADDDVVAIVDGDDWLASDRALQRLHETYAEGWEIVWGNWKGTDGTNGSSFHLNPFISPRQQPFVTSHLFSFRKRLFRAIEPADLQDDNGAWFRAGCDVAIALPLLEQTIKRKHLEEVFYVYNRGNPLSLDRAAQAYAPLVSAEQKRTSATLSSRPARPTPVDNDFLLAHLYDFLTAAALNSRLLAKVDTQRLLQQLVQARKG